MLVVYFSRAGENYRYGARADLEVGNTEVLAGFISARLDKVGLTHDVHRLEATDPYPDDYDAAVSRNVREQDTAARPALANPLDSIDGYDVVLIGSPIWNVRPPMLMHTFAEAHDFTGKTVYPLVTHDMSGLGTAEADYTAACPGAEIGEGLAVPGETVRTDGSAAAATWLDRMDLPGRPTDAAAEPAADPAADKAARGGMPAPPSTPTDLPTVEDGPTRTSPTRPTHEARR